LAIDVRSKVFFCDVGGVLIADPWALTAKMLSKEYGADYANVYAKLLDYSRMFDLNQLTLFGLWRSLSNSWTTNVPYSRFRKLVLDESLVKVPGVWNSVQWLRRSTGLSVFALSNMSRYVWKSLQEKYLISSLFDGEILSYKCGIMKPDPRIFKLALKWVHRSPADSIFLDDSARNVTAALSLGLTAHKASSPSETARFVKSLAAKQG
jgi:HAD superfamily hydrolase (TIGR01509 family)